MHVKNSARASDLGTLLTSGTTGFVVRKRTGIGMIFHFFLLACMVVLGASLLVYYRSPQGCGLAVAIGLSFALIAQNLEKMKKAKQSLEFMNALFSSALSKNHQFCCIVKATGEIIFYNRQFQAMFPSYVAQPSRMIDTLFTLYHMPAEHQEKLKSFMSANSEGMITTTVQEQSTSTHLSLTMYLEPIDRPTGFFLLRAR